MTHDELERGAAEIVLRQRTLVARLYRASIDEYDAALGQRAHSRGHVARAEPHADQPLFPPRGVRRRRRLDQLQIKRVTRALEQGAVRQHAEIPSVRERGEPEERSVEVEPVARPAGPNRLDHTEPVQPGE